MCIELIDEKRAEDFENALKDLAKLVQEDLGKSLASAMKDLMRYQK